MSKDHVTDFVEIGSFAAREARATIKEILGINTKEISVDAVTAFTAALVACIAYLGVDLSMLYSEDAVDHIFEDTINMSKGIARQARVRLGEPPAPAPVSDPKEV